MAGAEAFTMSDLLESFGRAQERVKVLPATPSVSDLLELYALYKQAVAGDVSGVRPGTFDFKGRAKFDAWSAKQGMSQDDAMSAYVAIVDRLEGQ